MDNEIIFLTSRFKPSKKGLLPRPYGVGNFSGVTTQVKYKGEIFILTIGRRSIFKREYNVILSEVIPRRRPRIPYQGYDLMYPINQQPEWTRPILNELAKHTMDNIIEFPSMDFPVRILGKKNEYVVKVLTNADDSNKTDRRTFTQGNVTVIYSYSEDFYYYFVYKNGELLLSIDANYIKMTMEQVLNLL